MRIALGADKVTLLEFARASLRLLFVIPGFTRSQIFGNLLPVRLTIASRSNKDKSRSRVSLSGKLHRLGIYAARPFPRGQRFFIALLITLRVKENGGTEQSSRERAHIHTVPFTPLIIKGNFDHPSRQRSLKSPERTVEPPYSSRGKIL